MGLTRLWLVPDGATPDAGAYVDCPARDLLRLLALESWRHRCIVIGEDLGVVPAGFRRTLRDAGLLGFDVLWFMRGRHGFLPPSRWRRRAVATTSTHDLPPLAAWWSGADIALRRRVGLLDDAAAAAQRAERDADRAAWAAAAGAAPAAYAAERFVDDAIDYVGRSRCELALLPAEDALALERQANVPGTVHEYPNWSLRLPGPAQALLDAPAVAARLRRFTGAREAR